MLLFNKILLMLHFLGLVMGLAVPFANIALAKVISKSAPPEIPILLRFPLVMSKIGKIGLGLLIVTGMTMVFTRWAGFSSMAWTFHVKLTAVFLLVIVVGYISILERRFKKGDLSVLPRIQAAGKIAFALGLIALVFAVITFN